MHRIEPVSLYISHVLLSSHIQVDCFHLYKWDVRWCQETGNCFSCRVEHLCSGVTITSTFFFFIIYSSFFILGTLNPCTSVIWRLLSFYAKPKFSIEIINGWCYSSCAKCPRKLQPRISSFTCTTCCNTNASVLLGSLLKNISYIIGTNIIPLIICTQFFFELKQLCFIRYRVAMLVVAREDSAVFVAFDASMTKLTNVMAVEVANPMVY